MTLKDRCWVWLAAIRSDGYGAFRVGTRRKGRLWAAHRYAWLLKKGPIPRNRMLCHKCDNTRCVRPGHIFLGDARTNWQDSKQKGRAVDPPRWLGEKHQNHILTEKAVREIRKVYTGKYGEMTALGRRYGVGRSAIYRVIRRNNWKHI